MENIPGVTEKYWDQPMDRPDIDLALSYWLCRTTDEFDRSEDQIVFSKDSRAVSSGREI